MPRPVSATPDSLLPMRVQCEGPLAVISLPSLGLTLKSWAGVVQESCSICSFEESKTVSRMIRCTGQNADPHPVFSGGACQNRGSVAMLVAGEDRRRNRL